MTREQVAETGRRPTGGTPLLEAMRPRQWPKNLLVLSAPAAAGVLAEGDVLATALAATVSFVLVSAGVYLVNDIQDRHTDASNPRTAGRPLASGRLSVTVAATAAAVLGLAGLALIVTTAPWSATAVLVTYVLLNLGYSFGLKDVVLVELMIVASGYVLRAAIGGLATGVPLSAWFLSVMSFAALYVVVVKRISEREAVGHRRVMDAYPDGLLEQVRSLALTATALTYVLWAFDTGAGVDHALYELSVAPFLLGLLRYALVTLRDGGASPEQVIGRDRGLQVVGLAWLVVVVAAVYV